MLRIGLLVLFTCNFKLVSGQIFKDISFHNFIISNFYVEDTVTGSPIDQSLVYNTFIHEWIGSNNSHYDGIIVDTYRKTADGYDHLYIAEKTILESYIDYSLISQTRRNFSEKTHYYEKVYNAQTQLTDTNYVFSRPRYGSSEDPKLYTYTPLKSGSYKLSNVTVQDKDQTLSDCYAKQAIEILPGSYFLLHYGDGYNVQCVEPFAEIHDQALDIRMKDDSVNFFTHGIITYLMVSDYIYLFTDSDELIDRLKIEVTDKGFALTSANSVKFNYIFDRQR